MRRRARGRLFALVMLVALVALAFFAGRAWLGRAMASAADPSDTARVAFTVNKGENAAEIAARLEARGLIRSGFAFTWQVNGRELGESFNVGTYRLSPSMTGSDILTTLTSTSAATRVTIPEGYTVAQIAQRLSDAGIADEASIVACAKRCALDLPLLGSRPEGAGLEGYLFPNTYEFLTGTPAQEVVEKLVRELDARLTADVLAKVDASGRTLHEVITMASMLEKEVTDPRDRRIVAGILWKRLERGIPLGVDATVIYALGEHRESLTADELRVDSPYNTRRVKGLPPGPICNPGIDTIVASVEPEASEWLFYLTDERGTVHYGRTNAEHEANKDRYL